MITWPLFEEQVFNEKFIVQVLDIGVRVGANVLIEWGEEEKFGEEGECQGGHGQAGDG